MPDSLCSPEIKRAAQLIRSCRSLLEARRVHEQVTGGQQQRCKNRYLANLLVEMYGRCGSVSEARATFDGIVKSNLYTNHIMIHAYAQNGHIDSARQIFLQMASRNEISWNTIVAASALNGQLQEARTTLAKMPEHSNVSCTAVMRASAQQLDLDHAKAIFDRMQQRDLISWTVLLDGYTQTRNLRKALEIFEKLPERDNISWTVLCQAYAVLGHLRQAKELFLQIPQKTLITWTTLIYAYAQTGYPAEALQLFWNMDLEGVEADEVTFVGVLTACSHAGQVKMAWEYFTSLPEERGLAQLPEHYHCMIDALGRAGLLNEAQNFVKNLRCVTAHEAVTVAWTSLLDACRIHGDVERGAEAAKQLIEMEAQNQKTAPYLLLSNIYAAARRPEDVTLIRQAMKTKSLSNTRAGKSEVEGADHVATSPSLPDCFPDRSLCRA